MATLCERRQTTMVNGGITSGRVTAYSLPALSINAPTCVYTPGSVYMYVESLYHDMHDSATARKNRENPGGAALSPPPPGRSLALSVGWLSLCLVVVWAL